MQLDESKIEFKQRSFFETRVFQLYKDRINVKELKPFENKEYTKPFEVICNERINIRSYPVGSLTGIAGSIFFFSFFAYFLRNEPKILVGPAVIFGVVILLFFMHLLFSNKKFTGYNADTKSLLFFKDLPSKEDLEDFLEVFEKRKKDYLYDKYRYVELEKGVGSEITKLFWLKDKGALTEEEFQIAKNKILGNEFPSQWDAKNRFN